MTKSINPHFVNTDHGWIFGYSELDKVDTSYYTAFEVYAHDSDIPTGESEELGGNVSVAIPASMTQSMIIRTNGTDHTKCDVIIDWGDGVITTIASGDYASANVSADDNETDYTVEHTYSSNGKYIVKIFGKSYYNIQGLSNSNANKFKYNLICRAFDLDLPVASHMLNFAGFLKNSRHLLKVQVPAYYQIRKAQNIAYLFLECANLISVKGLKNVFSTVYSANQVFQNCAALTTLEYTLPTSVIIVSGLRDTFAGCTSLSVDINDLLADNAFVGSNFDVRTLFKNCSALFGTVPADKLWNNQNITWINTSQVFSGCSAEIRAQVPMSWGGAANDNIINA